jgi:hypothetical protein
VSSPKSTADKIARDPRGPVLLAEKWAATLTDLPSMVTVKLLTTVTGKNPPAVKTLIWG